LVTRGFRLKHVVGWGRAGDQLVVTMHYIGGILSVNRYKTREGAVKSQVQRWMEDLAWAVSFEWRKKRLEPPIRVRLDGYFKDPRVPDLHNLHKVIGDALENGLGINDREFRFEDGEVRVGVHEPVLRITLSSLEVSDD
jgi:Holliday junction resolvase RusA-like endonuclease